MKSLPKISIITPSFNQGDFIQRTIESVLDQKYPNLEYIVMDGGSTDKTVEVLKKYSNQITWYSKKDNGQAAAINEGFKMASGEIMAYLNSDDVYENNCLFTVAEYFNNHDSLWLSGRCNLIDEHNKKFNSLSGILRALIRSFPLPVGIKIQITNFIAQPATFWKKVAIDNMGYLDESLNYAFDYDLWLRLNKIKSPTILNETLASFRIHKQSKGKTGFIKQFKEDFYVSKRYVGNPLIIVLHAAGNSLIILTYYLLNLKNAIFK